MTVAQRQADWDQRLKKYQPADLPELIVPLIAFGRRSAQYRLGLLFAKAGEDPRFAEPLARWVDERPRGYHGPCARSSNARRPASPTR